MNKKNHLVAIIGRPNVGKSTLFNRLVGRRLAITTDIPGTTRDRLYEIVEWQGQEFTLIDTAGLEFSFDERFKEDIQSQIEVAIEEADLIIFLTDVTTGITDEDQFAISKLRKSKKNSLLVVNKVDNKNIAQNSVEFYKLGLGDPVQISALNGKGTGDLLDEVAAKLKPLKKEQKLTEKTDEDITKIALLGRPNVGKSTLLNTLLGKNRTLVSEVAGTTRDIIESRIPFNDETIAIVDTAGIRRRGKVGKAIPGEKKETGIIERYSALRSFRAAEEADICVVLIDGIEGITAQDQHIAGFADDAGKGLIIAVNKIDIADELNQAIFLQKLKRNFQFVPYAPVVFISAKTGKNTDKLFEIALKIKSAREERIPTPKLNNLLERIILEHPPSGLSKTKPKLKYIAQVDVNPPTFVIFSSYSEKIHFSYKRFIENELRKAFEFYGTSIKIVFREKQAKKDK